MQRQSLAPTSSQRQTELENLKQQIRTLEHKNKLLQAGALTQSKWDQERALWDKDLRRLHRAHRTFSQRYMSALDDSNGALLRGQTDLRKARLDALRAEHKATLLETELGQLENTLEDTLEDFSEERSALENEIQTLNAQLNRANARLTSKDDDLGKTRQEHDEANDELAKMREDYAKLQVAHDSQKKKFERLQLKHDGTVTENNEITRERDDLKRANNDLKRQMEKWQVLEKQGDNDVENLNQRNVELQVQATTLETKIHKLEADLDKTKARFATMRERCEQWRVRGKAQIRQLERRIRITQQPEAVILSIQKPKKTTTARQPIPKNVEVLEVPSDTETAQPPLPKKLARPRKGRLRKNRHRLPKTMTSTEENSIQQLDDDPEDPDPEEATPPPKKKTNKGKGKDTGRSINTLPLQTGKSSDRPRASPPLSQAQSQRAPSPPSNNGPKPNKKRMLNKVNPPAVFKFDDNLTGGKGGLLPDDLSPLKPRARGDRVVSGSAARVGGSWQRQKK
ncbi:hypothetical protein DL96DRAFT_1620047 [Flagelloscypha sp. PMI_526]|nr:hypothetical protein DL96DRAFT_1620047 [Flagelloscypha sp. PMI_526]